VHPADQPAANPSPREWADAVASAVPYLRLPGRNRTKADLLVFDVLGRKVAVKDYRPRPFWFRQTVGRLLVRRESMAYLAAAGAPGLATFLGRLGPFALATEWVEARSLRDRREERIAAAVFDSLERTVEGLHRRGVALGDLHHRDVLVSDSGRVFVVDLATAWILGPNPSPIRRRIFLRLRESDRVNLARMRARFLEGREADLERDVGADAARRYRRSREWKSLWNRLRRKV
jgi:hypothetical protein